MKQSSYRLKKLASLKVRARKLYKPGLITREVGKLIGRATLGWL